MKYLAASQIYNHKIKLKGKYVPVLTMEEELQFKFLTSDITALAEKLNETSAPFRWFMFLTKRQYKKNVVELEAFLDFWGLDLKNKEQYDAHLNVKAGSA